MRTRDIKLQFWLSEIEADRLVRNARKTKMSKSAYIRSFINGYEPQATPPIEYYRLLKEMRVIGGNINQLAHRANITGNADYKEFQRDYRELVGITDELTQTFLPKKMQ